MRMSYGRNPGSEQAHEPPANAPQTEQQEGDHQAPSRDGRPVHREIAWIAGDEAHEKEAQREDGSCQRACQKAKAATDGDSAHNHPGKKAHEQAQREHEEFPCRQGECRLDREVIPRNLLAGRVEGPVFTSVITRAASTPAMTPASAAARHPPGGRKACR